MSCSRNPKRENAGWIVITTGWAFAVMCGVFTAIACGSADAHLNPAVTLGFAVSYRRFFQAPVYIAAQVARRHGGRPAGLAALPAALRSHRDPDLKFACFGTAPAIRRIGANLLSEAIGTFVLIVVVARHHLQGRRSTGPAGSLASGFGPYLVGMLVWAIGLSLGGTTGYAINPARDLGPRLMHAILPIARRGARTGRTPRYRSSAR